MHLRYCREHERNDLRLALESLREHGTHRSIDLAAGEDFALTHAAFALDEASGKTSAGVGVLAVIHGEREKIDPFTRLGIRGSGGKNNVVDEANNHRSVGLLGQLAGLKRDLR